MQRHVGRKYMPVSSTPACAWMGPTIRFAGLFLPPFTARSKFQCNLLTPPPGSYTNLAVLRSQTPSVSSASPTSSKRCLPGRLGVVLSACRGVTDALLGLVARAEAQDDAWRGELDALRVRHDTIAEALLSGDARQLYMAGFDRDRHDIEGILHTVKLTRSAAQNVRDLIAGYGEIWSTKLFREFFAPARKRPGDVQWIDARQAVVVEWGPLGPAVQWEESRAKLAALVGRADFKGTLIITGFIASRPPRRADHAGSQRQRLLGLDLRLAARCQRDPHLDRRRWRAVGRSAPRARCQGHRLAVVQRGHGARVLRRQGHPSADHGAGRRPRHSDLDPQHLRAGEAGHADLRQARLQTAGQGHHHHREHRAGQRRGRRHDRRARHGASPVRRAARGGHLGHPDLAGQLGAFDLLRHSRRRSRARRARGAPRPSIAR